LKRYILVVEAIRPKAPKSAKELKISASEISQGWEEYFYYMSDPAGEIEEFSKVFKKREGVFEFSEELSRNGVKDGYFLFLRNESPKAIVEVDVFVFDNASGAKEFYHFMKNEDYTSITSIGDESAFYSSGTSTHVWIVRYSNAFIKVITWDGQNTGRTIAEKIVEKAKSC